MAYRLMPLDRNLTPQSKFSVISQGQLEGTTVFTTEISLMRKQNVIEIQSVVESVIILYEYREIVNCQTIAKTAVHVLPHGRDMMAVFPTGLGKSMIFTVF